MDRWERPEPPLRGSAAAAASRAKPSFSSTLLDAIYRSIDDSSDARPATSNLTGSTHKPITAKPRAAAASTERRSRGEKPLPPLPPKQKHHHLNSATSSSSDSSSYNGFSSSPDADPPFHPAGLRPIRTNPTPPPPPEKKKKNNSKTRSTGSVVSRLRDLKKQTAPASPGARLASFLNSLFSASGSPRRARPPPPPQAAAVAAARPGPACSTARSCLSKTTSSREGGVKRSVRFYPVSVVVGPDSRPCGHKSLRGGDPAARRPPAAALAEGDDGDSDSSSDLFELENLGGSGGEYSDELPVYETTRVRAHRGVCQGW